MGKQQSEKYPIELCASPNDVIHSENFKNEITSLIEELRKNSDMKNENIDTLERLLTEVNAGEGIDSDEEKILSSLLENEDIQSIISEILRDIRGKLKGKKKNPISIDQNKEFSIKDIRKWGVLLHKLRFFPKLIGTPLIIKAIKEEASRQVYESLKNRKNS
ncbi:hypothetical protein HGA92_04785 [Candidatus Gracilibacteria bacterium]|nr:hypothetical protein [Candidatus Gracilibacteria bacterium]NUJ98449.1 hypothetical protein [Candidatus Gracilibacteria bacterium]